MTCDEARRAAARSRSFIVMTCDVGLARGGSQQTIGPANACPDELAVRQAQGERVEGPSRYDELETAIESSDYSPPRPPTCVVNVEPFLAKIIASNCAGSVLLGLP